jgi:hypothetical protein
MRRGDSAASSRIATITAATLTRFHDIAVAPAVRRIIGSRRSIPSRFRGIAPSPSHPIPAASTGRDTHPDSATSRGRIRYRRSNSARCSPPPRFRSCAPSPSHPMSAASTDRARRSPAPPVPAASRHHHHPISAASTGRDVHPDSAASRRRHPISAESTARDAPPFPAPAAAPVASAIRRINRLGATLTCFPPRGASRHHHHPISAASTGRDAHPDSAASRRRHPISAESTARDAHPFPAPTATPVAFAIGRINRLGTTLTCLPPGASRHHHHPICGINGP